MSYLDEYRTPKACYKKAPVRRESAIERAVRQQTQVLPLGMLRMIKGGVGPVFTINRDLVPGEAKFVKDPVR